MTTKISVFTSAMHLAIAPKNPLGSTVYSAIISSDTKIAESILRSIVTGVSSKMLQTYNYARDYYDLRLPVGATTQSNLLSDQDIANFIAINVNATNGVIVLESGYELYSDRLRIIRFLCIARGYTSVDSRVLYYPGYADPDLYRVTLVNSILSLDGLSVTVNYEIEVKTEILSLGTPTYEWIKYMTDILDEEGAVTSQVPTIFSEVIAVENAFVLPFNTPCFYTIYQKYDNLGIPLPTQHVWLYDLTSHMYPELEEPLTTFIGDTFLPAVPIRFNNVDLTGQDSVQHKEQIETLPTQIAAKWAEYEAAFAIDGGQSYWYDPYLSIDVPGTSSGLYDEWVILTTKLTQAETGLINANAIKETSLYKTSKKLLKKANIPFDYLGDQINANPNIGDIDNAYVMFGVDLQTKQSESLQYLNLFFDNVHSQEAFSNYRISRANGLNFLEYGLNLQLTYDSITSEIIEGMADIARTGTTTKTITIGLDEVLVLDTKISKTLIRRVTVTNLVLYNYVYTSHAVVTSLKDVLNDDKNHNFIIPIQFNLAKGIPLIKRNVLYTDGTITVINSYVIKHLRWYEEEWFKFVVIIVMVIILIIITIVSWGTLTAYWIQLCLAIEAGMYVAAVLMVVIPLIISLAISYIAKWLIREFGAQLGIIGSLILVCVALVLSSVSGLSVDMTQYLMTIAQYALQMGTALISAANEFLIEAGQKIVREYETFTDLLGTEYTKLKEKQDLLEMAYDVDPLIYVKPARLKIVPNETPDAFIQRCLGLVENTMYILHDEISNYFDNKLKLPRELNKDMYGITLGV